MSGIKKKTGIGPAASKGACGYFVETGPLTHSSSEGISVPRGIFQFLNVTL
jgi:hypothetical protein